MYWIYEHSDYQTNMYIELHCLHIFLLIRKHFYEHQYYHLLFIVADVA